MKKSPALNLLCGIIAGTGIGGMAITLAGAYVGVFSHSEIVSTAVAALFCTAAGIAGMLIHGNK